MTKRAAGTGQKWLNRWSLGTGHSSARSSAPGRNGQTRPGARQPRRARRQPAVIFDRMQGWSRVAATLQARHRALGGPPPHRGLLLCHARGGSSGNEICHQDAEYAVPDEGALSSAIVTRMRQHRERAGKRCRRLRHGHLPVRVVHSNANCHPRTRMSGAWTIQACLLPLGAGEKARRPDALLVNRGHSFNCRDCSIKCLDVDPGITLARLICAPDSHSSDHGEGKGDRRCRLAPSLTDRGRGYPTGIRIRGKGPQSATPDGQEFCS